MLSIDLAVVLMISIIVVLVLIFGKVNVAAALAIGSLLFGFLTFGPNLIQIFPQAFNMGMIRTLLALILAMFLAELYGMAGCSQKLVEGLSFFSPSFAALATPALVGLLPMPGGAYISAVILNNLYRKLRLNAEQKTFINYWFRHIWITTWPLYQGVILASGLLGISIGRVSTMNLPIMLTATIIGAIIGILIIRRAIDGRVFNERGRVSGLLHIWPFLLIAITTIILRMDLVISLIIVILMAIAIYKPSIKTMAKSLKSSLNPTFITIIVFSFIYSTFIEESGVAYNLLTRLSSLLDLAAFAIPFLIVVGTGVEFTFVALAFPPLAPLLKESNRALLLAFTGGFTGALLSPAHACLILSTEYYKASLRKVYKILAPTTITTAVMITFITTILY
jgi:integral membrane protein (TIGR00529 family)